MRAQLIPLDSGPPIELTKEMTLVGRKEDCDVRLDHKSISKQHCVLVKADGVILVRDLGSTNGTRVNGQRVRRAALMANDQLNVASLRFKVHIGSGRPQVSASECTQHLEASDVAALLGAQAAPGRTEQRSDELPPDPVKNNQLPDVYPNDSRPKE